MSLAQFWASIRAAWLTIVLMVVVASSVTFAIAIGLPKQYTARARVLLDFGGDDFNQAAVLKRGPDVAAYVGTAIRLVTDDAVMRDVVTKLGWPDNPQVISAWQEQTGGVGDVTSWAAAQITPNVAAQPLEESEILEIYYSTTSLEAAKQIVAVIRTSYIDQTQKLRVDAARRAAAWNRTQATRALDIVHAAEAERAAFVTANQIAVDTPAGGLDYQNQEAALTASTNHIVVGEAARLANPTADALARRLDTLDAQIAVLKLRGEQNPVTLSLEAERATVAAQLAREKAVTLAGPTASNDQIGLVRAQRDADYLKARLNLIGRSPLYDRLAAMDRDIAMKTQRYIAAAARVANFDAAAATPSGLRVIGDVIASDEPSYPNIPLMTGIAAAASLALAVAWALLADLSRRRVRDPEDLRFFAHAPVLAVIAGPARRRSWLAWTAWRPWARRRRADRSTLAGPAPAA